MIATLHGSVSEKLTNETILLVGGIGYGITLPQNSTDRLQIGETTKVYIYEHIKEDALVALAKFVWDNATPRGNDQEKL